MAFFGLPLGLLALASIPALAAIYWLRRQHRRRVVSSLVLWDVPRQARQGGVRLEPVRTPWLFLLEAGVLALLALAAAQPWLTLGAAERPMIVVLDDSFSMHAGARERALERVRDLANERRPESLRFIVAGAQPRWLSDRRVGADALSEVLEAWEALSVESALERAIAMGREVAGAHTPVLVLTDREPPEEPAPGVRWEAFGEPRANAGFINAVRSAGGVSEAGASRVMVEVAAFAEESIERELRLSDGRSHRLALEPGEVRQLWFDAPAEMDAEALEVTLSGDALALDDRVTLFAPRRPRVRVALDVESEAVAAPLRRALAVMSMAEITANRPHLLLTDRESAIGFDGDSATWLVEVMVERETRGYVGPFVLDRAHPLTDGLSLERVIWSAGEGTEQTEPMRGRPVIAAGNVPLVSDQARPDGSRRVRVRWRPEHSTLQNTPAFPALIWNLLTWRAEHLPGLAESNVRLGMTTRLRVERDTGHVGVTDPSGATRTVEPADGVVHLIAQRPGVYELTAGERTERLAVNALAARQSDLRDKTTGVWGAWEQAADPVDPPAHHQSMIWALLLAALGLLVMHGWLTTAERTARGARG